MQKSTIEVKITRYHIVLLIAAFVLYVCFRLVKDNKAQFGFTRYHTVEGISLPKTQTEDKKKTIDEPQKNDDDKPIVSFGGKEKESTPTPSVEKDDIKPATSKEVAEITPSVREEFFTRFGKLAVSEMHRTGVPASITMAQAAIEGRFGTSTLVRTNKNHFGIKCFSKTCPSGHCSNKTDDSHKDFFRVYSTDEKSFSDHSDFLVKNGYKKAANSSKDYRVWTQALQKQGYATDKNYGKKLDKIIENFGLDKLDKMSNL